MTTTTHTDEIQTPILDKSIGALLGVHIGDALGAGWEFKSATTIAKANPNGVRKITGGGAFNWKPGDATDDTDLTKAVLDAYLYGKGDVVKDAADNMLKWRKDGPKDIGGATAQGLSAYARTKNPYKSGAGKHALGNGSLMRCIPTALAVERARDRVHDARAISAITHDAPLCQWSCVAYVEMARALVMGGTPEQAADAALDGLSYANGKDHVRAALAVQKVLETGWDTDLTALREAWTAEIATFYATCPTEWVPKKVASNGVEYGGYYAYTKRLPEGPGGGLVTKGLRLAAAALSDTRDFEDALVDVIGLGDDTDTNGAIVGGILGARYGARAIPKRWATGRLQYGGHFRQAALNL